MDITVDINDIYHARYDIVVEEIQSENVIVLNTNEHIKDVRNAFILSNGDFIIELRDGERIRVGNLTTLLGSMPPGGAPNAVLVKSTAGDFDTEWIQLDYIKSISQDLTPSLGGNLNLNGFSIVGTMSNDSLTIDGGLL